MLNTDLHRFGSASSVDKKNRKKTMSKNDFIRNLQGVGNGSEIDSAYLSDVYDKIQSRPIEIREGTTQADDLAVETESVQTSITMLVENAKSVDAAERVLRTSRLPSIGFCFMSTT